MNDVESTTKNEDIAPTLPIIVHSTLNFPTFLPHLPKLIPTSQVPIAIPSGLSRFDAYLAQYGQTGLYGLITVVGPPGSGKTAYVLSWISNIDIPSLYIPTKAPPYARIRPCQHVHISKPVFAGMYALFRFRLAAVLQERRDIKIVVIDSMVREEADPHLARVMKALIRDYGITIIMVSDIADAIDMNSTDLDAGSTRASRRTPWHIASGPDWERACVGTTLTIEKVRKSSATREWIRQVKLEKSLNCPAGFVDLFMVTADGIVEVNDINLELQL